MTKISIDVDFNKDPESILEEIRQKAKSEVERREKKERVAAHLEKLHEKVNDEIGTSFKNANDLIRALAAYSTPVLRERIIGVTSTGRRKTITMTPTLLEQIKGDLKDGNKTKAQIARDSGVSPSQVTKVQQGGYDSKFSSGDSTEEESEAEPESTGSSDQEELPIPELEPKQEELSIPDPESDSLPLSPPSSPLDAEDGIDSGDESESEDEAVSSNEEDGDFDSEGNTLSDIPEPLPSDEGAAELDSIPVPVPPSGIPLPPEPQPEPFGEEADESSEDAAESGIPSIPPPPPDSLAESDDATAGIPDLGASLPPPEPTISEPPLEPMDAAAPAPSDEGSLESQDSGESAGEVPPAPDSPLKPKPSIKFGGGKKKPTLKFGKGKLSSDVTRPPMLKRQPEGDAAQSEDAS